MKVVLLAGGFGTRLSEETELKPKPMVDIGGNPIIWHIMKIYTAYGFTDFVVCLGYKGYVIKEYFANYFLHQSDLTINMKENSINWHGSQAEAWRITLKDTGVNSMTGGRIKNIKEFVDKETFMLTYGDGLSNVNLKDLLEFHKSHGKLVTVTAVQPSGKFGALNMDGDTGAVHSFLEKPKGDGAWVNGGFFVCEPGIFNYLQDDNTIWEREPLENIAKDGQLMSYKHHGFWKPMDTLRDKQEMENLWNSGKAEWKLW
jgi:glucose-1-phosphate cytidylyltransferase